MLLHVLGPRVNKIYYYYAKNEVYRSKNEEKAL